MQDKYRNFCQTVKSQYLHETQEKSEFNATTMWTLYISIVICVYSIYNILHQNII